MSANKLQTINPKANESDLLEALRERLYQAEGMLIHLAHGAREESLSDALHGVCALVEQAEAFAEALRESLENGGEGERRPPDPSP